MGGCEVLGVSTFCHRTPRIGSITTAVLVLAGCVGPARPGEPSLRASSSSVVDQVPWRVFPTAPDTFRTWSSGRAFAVSADSPTGTVVTFSANLDTTSTVRSFFQPVSGFDTISVWIRTAPTLTLAVHTYLETFDGGRTIWRRTSSEPASTEGQWREMRLPLPPAPDDVATFARLDVSVLWGRGVVNVTTPHARRYRAPQCQSLFAWTDGDLPIHFEGDTLRVKWVSTSPVDPSSINVRLLDARGASVSFEQGEPGSPTNSGTVEVHPLSPGWYEALLRSGDCVATWPFVLVPEPLQGARADALGLHVEFDSLGFEKAARLGAGWLRAHRVGPTTWPVIAPEAGTMQWPDSVLHRAARRGLKVLGSLDRTPLWASSAPDAAPYPWRSFYYGPAAYRPRDIEDWAYYVRSVVSRYDGLISAWEIWNEPDIQFLAVQPGGSHVDAYRSLLSSAHREVRAACADCQVVGPAVAHALQPDGYVLPADLSHVRERDFLERFLMSDDTAFLDVFSYHSYRDPKRCASTPACAPAALGEVVERTSNGGSRRVWRTEAGVHPELGSCKGGRRSPDDERRIATAMVTDFLATLAGGVERLFAFHGFFGRGPCEMRSLFWDGHRPRRTAAAFATLASVMLGRQADSRVTNSPFPGVELAAVLRGGGDPVWAVAPTRNGYLILVKPGGRIVTQWGAVEAGLASEIPGGEVAYLIGASDRFELAGR